MEKENSNLDIKHHEILYVILALFLLLLIYFIYVNSNFNISTENKNGDIDSDILINTNKTFNLAISYSDAIYSNDVKNCDNILEKDLIEMCKLKLTMCLNDDCYYDKALVNNDESICYSIEDDDKLLTCTYEIKKSNILQNAITQKNINLCSNLILDIEKINCVNNYYFALSKLENDVSYCSKIIMEELKNDCLSN